MHSADFCTEVNASFPLLNSSMDTVQTSGVWHETFTPVVSSHTRHTSREGQMLKKSHTAQIVFQIRIAISGNGIPVCRVIGIQPSRGFPHIRHTIMIRISARRAAGNDREATHISFR